MRVCVGAGAGRCTCGWVGAHRPPALPPTHSDPTRAHTRIPPHPARPPAGPAIYQFQQIEDRRPLFWEALLLVIGLAESYRVSVGWATPVGTGFNQLKDEYAPGTLYFDPLGLLVSGLRARWVLLCVCVWGGGRGCARAGAALL